MNPVPAIRMFSLCESMKWAHLPVAGGLYDQDPDLLSKFQYMFQQRAKHESEERQKQKRESMSRQGGARPVGRRRR